MLERLARAFSLIPIADTFPPLHGLRVLAIVSVLQVHLTIALIHHRLLTDARFAEISATVCFGMDLFFVMSGFLIGTMLLKALESRRRGLLARFYLRRAARIMPLYYVILTGLAVLLPISQAQRSSLVYEYVYLTNYVRFFQEPQVMGWAWSLCVEEHFYLAVPALLLVLSKVRSHAARIAALCALWSAGLGVRLGLFWFEPRMHDIAYMFGHMYLPTHTRFDTLVAGIFLAYVQHGFAPELRAFFAKRLARWGFYGAAGAGFYVLLDKHVFGETLLWNVLTWGTVTSLTYIALLLPLLSSEGLAQRALGSRPMYALATLSYGIYLLHVPVCERLVIPVAELMRAQPLALRWTASLALLVALSALFAWILHILVEKPFLRLRERIPR